MSEPAGTGGDVAVEAPSMLDLIRLSPRLLFPPGGRDLYRQIALLVDLSEGDELLVVGSANGVTLEYFVTEYGVQGSGVDFDEPMVAGANERARVRGLSDRLQCQQAPLDRLPYRDEIFDVVVGELGLTARADPEAAIRELVRVTRPGGRVAVVRLVWKAPVDEDRRRVLSEHLGVQPLMLVEWKRLLREAGVEHLHTEDWTDEQTAFRPQVVKPFPDFAELFSIPEKIGILHRAWRRWGWSGVRTVLAREREVHKLLTRERILGLTLVTGVRGARDPRDAAGDAGEAPAVAEDDPGASGSASVSAVPDEASQQDVPDGPEPVEGSGEGGPGPEGENRPGDPPEEPPAGPSEEPVSADPETRGLPLFRERHEDG